MQIDTIHESLINGQRKQMSDQIDEYGLYDFWEDYRRFLNETSADLSDFADAVISYHRIRNR